MLAVLDRAAFLLLMNARRLMLFIDQNGRCIRCQVECLLHVEHIKKPNFFTVDHIIPLSRGGTNHRSNTQGMCAACNREKGNKHPELFKTNKPTLALVNVVNLTAQKRSMEMYKIVIHKVDAEGVQTHTFVTAMLTEAEYNALKLAFIQALGSK